MCECVCMCVCEGSWRRQLEEGRQEGGEGERELE